MMADISSRFAVSLWNFICPIMSSGERMINSVMIDSFGNTVAFASPARTPSTRCNCPWSFSGSMNSSGLPVFAKTRTSEPAIQSPSTLRIREIGRHRGADVQVPYLGPPVLFPLHFSHSHGTNYDGMGSIDGYYRRPSRQACIYTSSNTL